MSETSRRSLQYLSWAIAIAIGVGGGLAAREKTRVEAKRDVELANTKRQLAEAQLDAKRAADHELNLLRLDAGHGYMKLDAAGRVLIWNETLVNWTGYTEQEMIGQTLSKVMAPEDYELHSTHYPEWIKPNDSPIVTLKLKCRLVAKDGHKITVLVTARKTKERPPTANGLLDLPRNVMDLTEN